MMSLRILLDVVEMIEKRSCVYICIVRIEYVNNEIRLGFALIHCCII
jgi:hypothetical protein